MRRIPLALFATFIGSQPLLAAVLTNSGGEPVVVQVADSSGRFDVSLDPGASEEICPSGCFVTLPNGDRIGLSGGETVDIHDGSASVN